MKGLLTGKQSLHVFLTSFSLKFGKLTTKFELLCKATGSPQFQNFGGETDGAADAWAMCVQRVRAREERRCERRMRVRGAGGS